MSRVAARALVAWVLLHGAQGIAPRAVVALRFHHLHYAVGDPSSAINHVAQATGGTRLLVPGLGAGVRIGNEYVLFERLVDAQSSRTDAPAVEATYRATVLWMQRRGIPAVESATGGARLAAFVGSERLDHIGFVADDFSRAVRALEEAGAVPLRRSDDAALFKIPGGGRIEIVKNTEGPDLYWCPMHPDVRAPGAGTCPVCGMDLVKIPPPRIGEFRMDVALLPAARGNGASGVRLTIRDPETAAPVTSFATVHERVLHLFVIGRDLEFFRHVHPERTGDGVFEVREDLPAGAYVLVADFLPQQATSQVLQRAVVTAGYEGPLFPEPPILDDREREEVADGVRVRLEADGLVPGREAVLRFTFEDAATRQPITDLEPFLGAPAHLLIVNRDLTEAIHAHPELDRPAITFEPLMPAAGGYKVWLQFQRKGIVTTVPFVLTVK